jgi:hypothetical protein
MQYRVTSHVSEDKKGEIITKVIKLESETPLSVRQIKDQCFTELKIDADKYTKGAEEVWQRGVGLKEANPDTEVLDKVYQTNPDYYLTVTKK